MLKFVVRANDPVQIRHKLAFKDEAETVEVDFSPWAEDNGTVSSVTWTTKSGQAAISGQTLVGNVATALITTSEAGGSFITLAAVGDTDTKVINLDVLAKDPHRRFNDYGLCRGWGW